LRLPNHYPLASHGATNSADPFGRLGMLHAEASFKHLKLFSQGSRNDQYSMTKQLLLLWPPVHLSPPMSRGESLWAGGICVKFRDTSPRSSLVDLGLSVEYIDSSYQSSSESSAGGHAATSR
jgi:hypothetical protein